MLRHTLREAALQFAAWGASIILACRNPPPTSREPRPESVVDECVAKARVSGHLSTSFVFWHVDLADLASVEAFTTRWLETKRPLDILCNNAGLASSPGGKKVFKTKDGFEIIHQVRRIYSRQSLIGATPSLSFPPCLCRRLRHALLRNKLLTRQSTTEKL